MSHPFLCLRLSVSSPLQVLKCGLKNQGNTCYLNAILVALYRALRGIKGLGPVHSALLECYQALEKGIQPRSKHVRVLTEGSSQQHDAAVVLRRLLERLRAENPQSLTDLNVELYETRTCQECGQSRSETLQRVIMEAQGGLQLASSVPDCTFWGARFFPWSFSCLVFFS